jgi:hypothetical protein
MKAKRSNYAGIIALLLVGAAGVYAFGLYVGKTPDAQKVPVTLRRTEEGKPPPPAAEATREDQASATVLTPKSEGGNLTFESKTESVPTGTDPIVFAVNRYLENSHLVLAGAKALHAEVKEGTANIDFTEAMEKKSLGSSDEAALLQGISKTLSQFPEVKKVQFFISGKPMSSLGNVDLSQPLDIKDLDAGSTTPGA